MKLRSGKEESVCVEAEKLSSDLEKQLRRRVAELESANKALSDIRAQFEAVYDHHYQMTGLIDREGRLLMANRAALEFAGVDREDVLGKSFWETPWWTHSQKGQRRLREAMERAIRGKMDHFETTHISAAGERRDVDFRIRPVFGDSGQVTYLVPEGFDITDRKIAEEKLREQAEMIQALVETSQDWIWSIDLEGTHTYSNPAVEAILGYRAEEIAGESFVNLLHEGDRKHAESVLAHGIENKQGWSNLLLRWRTKDGGWRFLESNAVPILDDKGELLGFRGVDRDITERKQAEETLRRQADFDAIIKRILARFARSASAEVDACIQTSLEEIGRFANVETAYAIHVTPDRTRWTVSHGWVASGFPDYTDSYQDVPFGTNPWYESKILDGEIISISSVEDFPPEADVERRRFEQEGVKSSLMVPLYGRDGMVTGCVGFRSYGHRMNWVSGDLPQVELVCEAIANVLERKRAEELLQHSEERYRGLVSTMQDIVHSISADGRILFIGPQVERYGFTQEELTSRPFAHFIDEEDRDVVLRRFQRTLATGEETVITFRVTVKDGRVVWFEELGRPVRDDDGNIVSISGMLRDVTESRLARQALIESNNKFRTIFELSPQGIALTEIDSGKVIDVNQKFCETVQYSKEEIIGRTTTELGLYSESDRTSFAGQLQRSGEVTGLKMGFKAKDGSVLKTLMFSKIIEIEGKHLILSMFHDVTVEEQLKEQLLNVQKMEAIGTLAGGIAHDFNNILTSVIGFTELALDDTEKDSSIESSLQQVYAAGKRARDLVKQILAFARQSEEELKPLQPGAIAKEVIKFIRSTIPSTIEINHHVESESLIMGNVTQVHQVIMNLCTNAAHAMEGEGGTLEVSVRDTTADRIKGIERSPLKQTDYVEIRVSDTGVGIPPDIMDSIFEPYFTTKGPGEGTGIGLAVVQGIVETYRGRISVESNVGGGTTFRIYLPTIQTYKQQDADEPQKLQTGEERILFVDDEAAVAKMGGQILSRLGYSVTTRTSSVEALELFMSGPEDFDLVVTDMTMPNMTGDVLATELMKIRPDIPVILCTGYSKRISDESTAEIGIKALAFKPFAKVDLANIVRKALDEAKAKK